MTSLVAHAFHQDQVVPRTAQGLGFRVWGLGCGVGVWGLGFGFGVWGLGSGFSP